MKTCVFISVVIVLMAGIAHGQIILTPEVTGTSFYHYHYYKMRRGVNSECSSPYATHYLSSFAITDAHSMSILLGQSYQFDSGFTTWTSGIIYICQTTIDDWDWAGILKFNLQGLGNTSSNFTPYNWSARLNNLVVEAALNPGSNGKIELWDMVDEMETSGLTGNERNGAYQCISTICDGVPESGVIFTDIDVTEALRRDLFGEGTGDLTSGFILKATDYGQAWNKFNNDSPVIEISIFTPTPSPSPTPTPFCGVHLYMGRNHFTAGDVFKLRALISGYPETDGVDLYVVLDVYGQYYFYPDWTQSPGCQYFPQQGETMNPIFILTFQWPEGDFGVADNLMFWGAILDPDSAGVIGDIDSIEFGFD